jgi:plasmid stabilization system protein ParE
MSAYALTPLAKADIFDIGSYIHGKRNLRRVRSRARDCRDRIEGSILKRAATPSAGGSAWGFRPRCAARRFSGSVFTIMKPSEDFRTLIEVLDESTATR